MVRKLFKKTGDYLFSQQSSILSAAGILMFSSLISALLGIVRWRLLFTYFGNSSDLGLYLLADRIPSFIFTLIISGAFSLVFIPVLSKYIQHHDVQQASKLVGTCFTSLMLVFSLLLLIGIFASNQICIVISLGKLSGIELNTMSSLLKLMLVAQFGLVFSAFLSAYLQAHKHFVMPALAPVAYWLGYILVFLMLVDKIGIYSAAYAMILGSILHFLVQLPLAIKLGFRLAFSFNFKSNPFRDILRLMGPRILGQFGPELGRLVEGSLAISINIFSPALLTAAQTLYLFPMNFIAVSLAQAAFPFLAAKNNGKDTTDFSRTLMSTIHQILFFMVPITFLLIVLRLPIVRIVFGSDEFRWESTLLTGLTLAMLSFGLIPEALLHVLVRAFYALHDTKTPLKIGVIATVGQIGIGAILVWHYHLPIWGLGIAATVGIWVQMLLLLFFLRRKIHTLTWGPQRLQIIKIFTDGIVSGALTYTLFKVLDRYSWGQHLSLGPLSLPTTLYNVIIDTRYTINLIIFTAIIGIFGSTTYLFLAYLMGINEVSVIYNAVIRLKHKFLHS